MASRITSWVKGERRLHRHLNRERELNDLPYEILCDILSRLPITSLSGVRYTCKLWHTIITNDFMFSELHLTQSLKNPRGYLYSFTGEVGLYFADNNTLGIKLPKQFGHNVLGDYALYDKKLFVQDKFTFQKYASSHGLMCYCPSEGDIYVFNPIIGEHIRLPTPPYKSLFGWGFGYAPVTKLYKCYCISFEVADGKVLISSAVYTLGDESWRDIGLPYCICTIHAYSNGHLFWKLNDDKETVDVFHKFDRGYNVLSFDLEMETFRKRWVNCNYDESRSYLVEVGETVAMLILLKRSLKVTVLIDEAKDVWVKMYDVSFGLYKGIACNCGFNFFGIWMKQEWYCVEGLDLETSKAVSVDHKTSNTIQLRLLKHVNGDGISPQLVIPHVASLVSPLKVMAAAAKQHSGLVGCC